MTQVFLIGCGKRKRREPCIAVRLYTGGLFKSSLIYALQRVCGEPVHERVFVLSARYGLLSTTDVVVPYDLRLDDLDRAARREWGLDVADALHARGLVRPDVELVVLAGRAYVDALRFGLEDLRAPGAGPAVSTPLEGLGIGQRLAWLKARIAEGSPPEAATA